MEENNEKGITLEQMRDICFPSVEMEDDCGKYSTFCSRCPFDKPSNRKA